MDSILKEIFEKLTARGMTLTLAESCTGGMIAVAVTDVPGASAVFDRGFVTYSNQAKMDMLSVPPALLEAHGAVSAQVAASMAKGALEHSAAAVALSVTGIAGPGGSTQDKPVGLVYIGVATWEKAKTFEHRFNGSRADIRADTVKAALQHLHEILS